MPLYPIALLTALLPIVTINLTYLFSALGGHVEWCFPYTGSCSSISATGREPPAYFVFKGLMIPAGVFLMGYWLLTAQWLAHMGCPHRRWRGLLIGIGFVGSVGLIFYTLVLGAIGDHYRLMRQTGVTAFFGLSFLAQVVLTWLLAERPRIVKHCPGLLRGLKFTLIVILVLGLANIFIGYINYELYKRIDNAIAWNFTLLLCCHTLVSALLWRRTGWRMAFNTNL